MKRISFNWQIIVLASIMILLILYIMYMLQLIQPYIKLNPFILIAITLVLFYLLTFAFRYVKNFTKGEIGEEKIGEILKSLPATFYHIPDYQNGPKGNIDHVVIGPTGIWAIEVKNYHKGRITVNNSDLYIGKYYIRDGLTEPLRHANNLASDFALPVPVEPVLVFSNPKNTMHFRMNKQKGVYVIGVKWLLELILNPQFAHPLNPEQCKMIHEELKKYSSKF